MIPLSRRGLFSLLASILIFASTLGAWQFPLTSASASARTLQRHPEENKWLGVSTPHFELYTTNDGPSAVAAVQRFEQVYDFFSRAGLRLAGNATPVPQTPVQIIAFKSESEYQAHRISASACAYYQRTSGGDYIVMQDLTPDHYQVGVHEYTHYIFEHSGLKLPLWLSEGLADFYSSLESRHGQVILGRPPYGRLRTLRTQAWIEPETLFAVTQNSPYYSQPGKMAIFYSESWALTHMLAMDPEYAPQFPHLLTLISNGTSSVQALQTVYRKTTGQLAADLNNYLQQRLLPVQAFDLTLSASAADPKPISSPGARADFALAALAASNPYSSLGAASQLDNLAKKYPESPEAEESLGYFALRQNRMEDAREHFAKAVERHSTAPDVIFYLAHLDLAAGGAPGPVIGLLRRVLELDPNHYNARLELGLAAAKANQFDVATSTLASISNIRPEHSFLLAYTLAYCYSQTNRQAEARTHAEKARRLAREDADMRQVETLLRYIDSEIQGDTQRLASNTATASP